ncbi:hypothetical protein [Bifidobacterium indicum]|nr:hypothetical protein [uncultured Bifidobacterium sp.]
MALANGLIIFMVGVHWGGRLFDNRQFNIIRTLDRFAILQS